MGYYSNNTDDWTEQTQETALIGHFSFCMCHHRNFLLVFLHHSNSRQDNGHYKFCSFQFVSPVFTSSFSFFLNAVLIRKLFLLFLIFFFFLLNHWCLKFAQRKRYLTNKCDVIIIYDLVCMHSVCVCVCA